MIRGIDGVASTVSRAQAVRPAAAPGLTDQVVLGRVATFGHEHRALLIADMRPTIADVQPFPGEIGANVAIYAPWLLMPTPSKQAAMWRFRRAGGGWRLCPHRRGYGRRRLAVEDEHRRNLLV